MANAKELAKLIGRQALYRLYMPAKTWLLIPVKIVDARSAYGRQDVQITPIGGQGTAWISIENVELQEEGFVDGLLP